MENASKALIIAGAILLAILIISLGIMIYSQASNAINNGGMSDAEVTAFNQKFTKYQGHQKGSTVRTLVQEVMSNNHNEQASEETYISVTGVVTLNAPSDGTTSPQPTWGGLQNTKTYNVSFEYTNGRVSKITITAI